MLSSHRTTILASISGANIHIFSIPMPFFDKVLSNIMDFRVLRGGFVVCLL